MHARNARTHSNARTSATTALRLGLPSDARKMLAKMKMDLPAVFFGGVGGVGGGVTLFI